MRRTLLIAGTKGVKAVPNPAHPDNMLQRIRDLELQNKKLKARIERLQDRIESREVGYYGGQNP